MTKKEKKKAFGYIRVSTAMQVDGGYNLDGKIKATNFVQKKAEEHVKPDLVAQPVVKLATAENFSLTEAKEERLSQIISEINSRTGKSYDNDVAVKAMLQIRDIMLKSEKLKSSARCLVSLRRKYIRACGAHKGGRINV